MVAQNWLKFLFSVNLYYFIEHHEARKDEEPEVENEISELIGATLSLF